MPSGLLSTCFMTLPEGERVVGEFEVVDQRNAFYLGDLVALLFLACFLVVPALFYLVYILLFRESHHGMLVLTTARLGYYQRSSSAFGSGHLLFQVQLENVIGITSMFARSLGSEAVEIVVLTSYGDGFRIGCARGAGLLGMLPGLSKLVPNTIGKDTYRVTRSLYGLIDAVRKGKEEAA
ncbi:MAG: hypothetical protein HYZ53_26470 [Planctomycetes bacterium]|nr:hypothetical protein [Planctomycetota bacterium]